MDIETWFELLSGPRAHEGLGVSRSYDTLEEVNSRIAELSKGLQYTITKHTHSLIEEGTT